MGAILLVQIVIRRKSRNIAKLDVHRYLKSVIARVRPYFGCFFYRRDAETRREKRRKMLNAQVHRFLVYENPLIRCAFIRVHLRLSQIFAAISLRLRVSAVHLIWSTSGTHSLQYQPGQFRAAI